MTGRQHISASVWADERADALTALARTSLTHVDAEAHDPLVDLEAISLTLVEPIAGQEEHLVTQAIFHIATSLAGLTKSVRNAVWDALVGEEEFPACSRDLERISLSRNARAGSSPSEMKKLRLG